MRILIVDDEQLVCEGIRAILLAIDGVELEIRSADSAACGKKIVQDFFPHLIVTDVEMPGGDGLEFAKYVKEHYPEIVVWILSGHDDFLYVRTALHLHVEDYLLKPLDVAKFQEMVRKLYMEFEKEYESVYRIFFPETEQKRYSPRLTEMMEYIHENITHDISLKRLTDVFHCSEAFICNLFRQEMGKTFLEFVTQERMRYAFRALLSGTHRSIHQIALDIGYSDERQFFRRFKELTGLTPNQLRQKFKDKIRKRG